MSPKALFWPNPKDHPHIKFNLASVCTSESDGPVLLSSKDIEALPSISGCIAATIKVLPDQVEVHPVLLHSTIHLCLVSIHAGAQGVDCAQKIGDEIADLLDNAADNLRENAGLIEPQPFTSVVASKPVQTLLKAFATANEESPLRATFVRLDGTERVLPVIDTAELPVVIKRIAESMPANAKIIGLIRGERGAPHQLIIEGGVHIQLPLRSPWEWDDIHFLLESPHWITGTLVRVSESNKWTIDSDAEVTSQAEIDLARVGA